MAMDPGMSNESIDQKINVLMDFLFLRLMLFTLSNINVEIYRMGKSIGKNILFPERRADNDASLNYDTINKPKMFHFFCVTIMQ